MRAALPLLVVVAGCTAVVDPPGLDPRLVEDLTGAWVAESAGGRVFLVLADRDGTLTGAAVHGAPGLGVTLVGGQGPRRGIALEGRPFVVPHDRCTPGEETCCAGGDGRGNPLCVCAPDGDGGRCRVRELRLDVQASGLEIVTARGAEAPPPTLIVEADVGPPGVPAARQTLRFHRLRGYYERLFGAVPPESTEPNADLDCEERTRADPAPGDPDADGDGLPDGCLDLLLELNEIPAAAALLLAASQCGDGRVQPREECDDGNDQDRDGCAACRRARCGDGIVQAGAGEECDDGAGDLGGDCPRCRVARCGDGLVRTRPVNALDREECDDANREDLDGCRNDCSVARCGDGVVSPEAGEECEDGNDDRTDACPACRAARCGDGFVRAGLEECDDGNGDDRDACLTGCRAARCGDGSVQDGVEVCDDGDRQDGDGCNATCTLRDDLDFAVNTIYTGDQLAPAVACHADGGFAVAWQDASEGGPDQAAEAVRVRLFQPDGAPRPALGGVFDLPVNTTYDRGQARPAIAAAADGGFLVAWEDDSASTPDTPRRRIRARLFGDDGAPRQAEDVALAPDGVDQSSVALAPGPGGFVAVWSEAPPPRLGGQGRDIVAVTLGGDGQPTAAPVIVNSTRHGDQEQPQLAVRADGRLVIVWHDDSLTPPDTKGLQIRARLLGPGLEPLPAALAPGGGDFGVTLLIENDQVQPLAAWRGQDGFVVVWTDTSQLGSDRDISAVRARLFDADGAPEPGERQINSTERGLQQAFGVAAAPGGAFAVTFADQSQSGADESSSSARLRAFSAGGAPLATRYGARGRPVRGLPTDDFVVNTRTLLNQFTPSLCARPDGSVVVAFTDVSALGPDTLGWAVRARILFGVLP